MRFKSLGAGALCGLLLFGGITPSTAWAQDKRLYYQKVVTPSTPMEGCFYAGYKPFEHPTTMAFGPDGKLYIAQRNGIIRIATLDVNLRVVEAMKCIDTIYNLGPLTNGRTVTGMAFQPGTNDLFVSHSDGRIEDTSLDTRSGQVTRLHASASPAYTTHQSLFPASPNGLPRSYRDHGPSGLAFDTQGYLYIAQGGLTNAGAAYASDPLWNLAEMPDSAAILKFDFSTGTASRYATGLRNSYEMLFHSNGMMYANDNGPNPASGGTPSGTGGPGCTTGVQDSVNYQDELNVIIAGKYYGHPNPARDECRYLNHLSSPSPTPFPSHYLGPIAVYGNNIGATGIAEYTSTQIPALQGNIITAQLAQGAGGGGKILAVKLGADKVSTVGLPKVLWNGLISPLDVLTRNDGSIFVAEHAWHSFFPASLSAISVLRKRTIGPQVDYDNDGRTDIAIWNPSTGHWNIQLSGTGGGPTPAIFHGSSGDIPLTGDYDGDRFTDIGVWQPSSGRWFIRLSSTATEKSVYWGGTPGGVQDIPVPGDYDGDSITDIAVWRPSDGRWIIQPSTAPTTELSVYWGGTPGGVQDIPVPGDYDGDSITDIAVWRPSDGRWIIRPSTAPTTESSVYWGGTPGDIPVPGDYDGDSITDVAVWRPSDGRWIIRPAPPSGEISVYLGSSGHIPVLRRQ